MDNFDERAAKDTSSMMIWIDNRIMDVKTDILSEVRPEARDLVEKYIERLESLIITRTIEVLIGELKKSCK